MTHQILCEPVFVCPKGLRTLVSCSGSGGASVQPHRFQLFVFRFPLSLSPLLVRVVCSVGLLCPSCSLFLLSCLSLSSAPSSPRRAGGSLSAFIVHVCLCAPLSVSSVLVTASRARLSRWGRAGMDAESFR